MVGRAVFHVWEQLALAHHIVWKTTCRQHHRTPCVNVYLPLRRVHYHAARARFVCLTYV